jgi:hypothetical protein
LSKRRINTLCLLSGIQVVLYSEQTIAHFLALSSSGCGT